MTTKVRVSERFLRTNYGSENIFSLGYCSMQNLLRALDVEPLYYTRGIYGWNADIYVIDDVVICTGYRPIGKKAVKYDELRHVEEHLNEIRRDYSLSYNEMQKKSNAYARRAFKRLFKND